ncbi:MAG: hypothetical protein IB618_01300 [Candidatus Pacearchaeota archaeon]|nr:MAG: hypothetical protein IB618_01300 [Candidatus Pacearchaeota archaeon]
MSKGQKELSTLFQKGKYGRVFACIKEIVFENWKHSGPIIYVGKLTKNSRKYKIEKVPHLQIPYKGRMVPISLYQRVPTEIAADIRDFLYSRKTLEDTLKNFY